MHISRFMLGDLMLRKSADRGFSALKICSTNLLTETYLSSMEKDVKVIYGLNLCLRLVLGKGS